MPRVQEGYLTERRRQILAAASRVFSRKGVQAATMADIAREAEISPGLIYRYFPSKDDLVFSCTSESAQEIEDRWSGLPDETDDPLGDFEDLSRETFGALEHPLECNQTILALEHTLGTIRDGDAAGLASLREKWAQITGNIRLRLEAAQRAGQLDPGLDPAAVARALFAFYWGTRVAKAVDPSLDARSQLETVMTILRCASHPRPRS